MKTSHLFYTVKRQRLQKYNIIKFSELILLLEKTIISRQFYIVSYQEQRCVLKYVFTVIVYPFCIGPIRLTV